MKIFVEKTGKSINKKFDGSVAELLSLLKINPETVLVARQDSIVTGDEILENKDEVRILSVISGG